MLDVRRLEVIDTNEVALARNVSTEVARHGLNVFPLEAYGFVLGRCWYELAVALPVHKTTRWYHYNDRFASLSKAALRADAFAAEFALSVVGTYHSVADEAFATADRFAATHSNTPVDIPGGFLFVVPTHGHETMSQQRVYTRCGGTWVPIESRRVNWRSMNLKASPRRIRSAWRALWGPIDYGYTSAPAPN